MSPLRAFERHPTIENLEARRLLTVSINEFGGSATIGNPDGITSGPDGNLWFTEANPQAGAISRITPSGAIERFSSGLPTGATPTGIATGPDGALWFTEPGTDEIGQINTSGNITNFAIPTANSSPDQITAGPDGALWFTENASDKIGRIDTSGNVTEFAIPTVNSRPVGIVTGPNGNLWFTESNTDKIGEISTSDNFTEFTAGITANSSPTEITVGSDGNLWFTENEASKIGRITSLGVVTEFSSGITANSGPFGITSGSDGNLWFTEQNNGQTGRITTGGVVTEFSNQNVAPLAEPTGITSGPDGNLWSTEFNASFVDRITTGGSLVQFPSPTNALTPGISPVEITTGSDGALWFSEQNPSGIGRIDTSGNITEFTAGITLNSRPSGVTLGPNGNIWFTEANADQIGEITPQGVVSEFSTGLTSGAVPLDITNGPDGNLYFTENGNQESAAGIGEITPQGFVSEFRTGLTSGSGPIDITTGPDHNLWFTATTPDGGEIGRISPPTGSDRDPTITEFTIPNNTAMDYNSNPIGIVSGFNGELWFADQGNHAIGEISTAGVIQEFSQGLTSNDVPDEITTGPDGNYWFTDPSDDADPIGQITPDGDVTLSPTPTNGPNVDGITTGPDQNIWFTESNADQIGQAVLPQSITNAAGTPATVPATVPETFELATFTDSSTAVNAANFSATIDYGDGKTGPGTILPLSTPGEFEVLGTHDYATVGQFTATITIGTNFGTIAPVTAQVTTTNPITLTGSSIAGIEGVRANSLVATFTDADTSQSSFDFTATVDWGDNSTPTSATIIQMTSGTTTYFAVYAGHVYATDNTYQLTVTVTDQLNGLTATVGPSGAFVASIAFPEMYKVFNEFGPDSLSVGAGATAITEGPDGAFWFVETNNGNIGRVDTSGNVTEFTPPSVLFTLNTTPTLPAGIATGPDGNLWYTDPGTTEIGQLTPGGVFTLFSDGLTANSQPFGITSGPDGNLWFTEAAGNQIGRITTAGVITEFSTGLTAGFTPESIVTGPDGNLWFVGPGSNLIGRITPQGVITEFAGATGSDLSSITVGSDGDLWFTEQGSDQIGMINPTTFQVTEYSGGLVGPTDITPGPGNNLYFTETANAISPATAVGQITTSGTITTYSNGLTDQSVPYGIVAGPDGNLYFTERAGDRIGQMILPQTSAVAVAPTPIPTGVSGHPIDGIFATFTDNSPAANVTNFLANIDYGDGDIELGTVVPVMMNGVAVPGSFDVIGSHVYKTSGSYPVVVTVFNDVDSTAVDYTLNVQNPFVLAPAIQPGNLQAIATRGFNGQVAFLSANFDGATASDFTGTISWGDSTTTVPLFVGFDGEFNVAGTKFYAAPGNYSVVVTVTDITSGYSQTVTSPLTVSPAPLQTAINETVGTTATGTVPGITPAGEPLVITLGPDGNLWFTEQENNVVGKISTSGIVTEYPTGDPANAQPVGITAGPDGALWYTLLGTTGIDRITTSGVVTHFTEGLTPDSAPEGITLGPDGNLWFTESDAANIGRITPSGVITEFEVGGSNSRGNTYITSGPDGALWYTDPVDDEIGRITTKGVVTTFAVPTAGAFPTMITTGPDGNLWFTESVAGKIGRITPQGVFTEFTIPGSSNDPVGITTGPDGNLWFTNDDSSQIGRITPGGTITIFSDGVTARSSPYSIVTGPDGNLYFTEGYVLSSRIGQVVLPQTSLIDPAPTPVPSPAQGDSFSTPLATFRDNSSLANLTNFQATINWGDDTTSTGIITESSDGLFTVGGTHTYLSPGVYHGTIIIGNEADSATPLPFTITVETTSLQVTGLNLTEPVKQPFTAPVADFTDSFGRRPSGSYVVSIDWGDGTTSPGTFQAGPAGGYVVDGSHTYATSGSFRITTTITVINTANSASATSTATVVAGLPSFVVTNVNDSGPGSLRQALLNADQFPGHTVTFAIPTTGVATITLLSPLPEISSLMVIDGFTQPIFEGLPYTKTSIEIDGRAVRGTDPGLLFDGNSGGSYLEGVSIFGFGGPQVALDSPGLVLWGNLIGLRADGTIPTALTESSTSNPSDGIMVLAGSETIGGLGLGQINVISGNTGQGIEFSGTNAVLAQVLGNFIGVDPTGSSARPNALDGIAVDQGAGFEEIGPFNVISGNAIDGIILVGSLYNTILGNKIGTDSTGFAAIGNRLDGIDVDAGTAFTTVGGPFSYQHNVISGNGSVGVAVQQASNHNEIQDNFVGTNVEGNAAIGNGIAGVLISDSPSNIIGPGDVISGNGVLQAGAGIWIDGTDSGGNVVVGDEIGTDLSGELPIGNAVIGILINDAPDNQVGGYYGFTPNVISGNTVIGVMIAGSNATGNVVSGNMIGADVLGVRAVPNGSAAVGDGVYIDDAPGNIIGGPTSGMGNVISGNAFDGIQVFGPASVGNLIQGNSIGISSQSNSLGNADDGLVINGAPRTLIVGNYLSSNGRNGITLSDPASTNTLIESNVIGEGVTGQSLGNGAFGIVVINAAPEPTYRNNIIANNTLGPIRDTNLAASAPNPITSTGKTTKAKKVSKKVQAKSESFSARSLTTLQDRGKAKIKTKG